MSTLAEIVAEAKRLEEMERNATSYSALADARTLLQDLYIVHGPRLARVAEKAMEMRERFGRHCGDKACVTCNRIASFDAEARGEEP